MAGNVKIVNPSLIFPKSGGTGKGAEKIRKGWAPSLPVRRGGIRRRRGSFKLA